MGIHSKICDTANCKAGKKPAEKSTKVIISKSVERSSNNPSTQERQSRVGLKLLACQLPTSSIKSTSRIGGLHTNVRVP